jgi:[acyl-carrier-protein] S-malonyltransferase/trans-AT polyketide synthase/acyltransferase/oxidoreductase domain-containing protein
MARDFHERFAASRDAFAEASDALGLDVAALCFGQDPRLDQTEFTQPAIVTAEIAMVRALEAELGLSASVYGGHSLGEYTALCAAGALPLATTVRLVRRRGALMQGAMPIGESAMIAVIAEDIASRVAGELAPELATLGVDVANRNSGGQVVLSGPTAAIGQAGARLAELLGGGAEIVSLNVSAAFHSRLMRGIEPDFRAALEASQEDLQAGAASVVTSNLTGAFHLPQRRAVIDALTGQISGTVDWISNMHALAAAADEIVEIGPNRPLRGFFRTIGRDVISIVSVTSADKGLSQ